jgi:hypothetical protein
MAYPQYADILHGFTYNGHGYIVAFVCLTLAVCFFSYSKNYKSGAEMNVLVLPTFIWILINIGIAVKLKGAAFLILPVFFAVLSLGYYVITQKNNPWVALIFSIPTVVIIAPFIQMFPVGLGLKILVGSALLTVLGFTLMLPVFGAFTKKRWWGLLFALLCCFALINTHFNSDYSKGKAKPNSLLYVLNADTKKAFWTTYDQNLDEWTKAYLGENPVAAATLNTDKLYSKYGSTFTFMKEAPVMNVPQPTIEFLTDSIQDATHYYKIKITPNRKVNRYDLFANDKLVITDFKANNVSSIDIKSNIISKKTNKILSYYVVENFPLTLEFSIPVSQNLDMHLMESSFDLIQNPLFKIRKRSDWMIATPFVLNDAVVIKKKIVPTPKTSPNEELKALSTLALPKPQNK